MSESWEYWEAVRSLDRGRCWSLAEAMVAQGRTSDLIAFVGDAQRRVGEEWARARWSVAQEHAATAINDAVLSLVEVDVASRRGEGRIAILCVEDEWHSMPARLLTLGLRRAGWDVLFFGASLPTDHARHLVTGPPLQAIGVSCTMPAHLFRVLELSQSLAGRSPPLLGGGTGFGPGGRWASRVGIDAFAASGADAQEIIRRWKPGVDRSAGPPASAPRRLADQRDRIVGQAMSVLEERVPMVRSYNEYQRRHTIGDFGHILEHLDAATLVDDDELFSSFATWLQALLTSRAVPSQVLPISLRCLAGVLTDHDEAVARVLAAADELEAR
jgi:methanogenic corrinoid protein MtbC1